MSRSLCLKISPVGEIRQRFLVLTYSACTRCSRGRRPRTCGTGLNEAGYNSLHHQLVVLH